MGEGLIENGPRAPSNMHYELEWIETHLLLQDGHWFCEHVIPHGATLRVLFVMGDLRGMRKHNPVHGFLDDLAAAQARPSTDFGSGVDLEAARLGVDLAVEEAYWNHQKTVPLYESSA